MSESEQKKLNLGTKTPSNVPKLCGKHKTGTNQASNVPKSVHTGMIYREMPFL